MAINQLIRRLQQLPFKERRSERGGGAILAGRTHNHHFPRLDPNEPKWRRAHGSELELATFRDGSPHIWASVLLFPTFPVEVWERLRAERQKPSTHHFQEDEQERLNQNTPTVEGEKAAQ